MDVELLRKARARRIIWLCMPSGEYIVEYNGWGMGYESVLVNRKVVAKEKSMLRMVPRFEFPIGPHTGVIQIETKLWRDMLGPLLGRLESFVLKVDDSVVYEDRRSDINKLHLR